MNVAVSYPFGQFDLTDYIQSILEMDKHVWVYDSMHLHLYAGVLDGKLYHSHKLTKCLSI